MTSSQDPEFVAIDLTSKMGVLDDATCVELLESTPIGRVGFAVDGERGKYPEFKGNVAAVLTEKYWDMEVVQLREREKKIKQEVEQINNEMKEGKLTREQGLAAVDAVYSKTFTPREMEILKKSTSNFDFHYMGSAKIMAQIGKGFAEAMAGILQR